MNELLRAILFLPEQASTFARKVDTLHYFVIASTMIGSTAIGLAALYFFARYRRRHEGQRTPPVKPGVLFEALIVVGPLVLFLAFFGVGYADYMTLAYPPKDAMDVYVTGKKWMWEFSYPGGPNSIAVLHVPAKRPVRLLLTSRDVIHSFFVPAFRLKQDALPGRYTQTWFEATAPGRYQVFCTEYCGTGHSAMLGEVVVMPPREYDAWLEERRRGLGDRADSSQVDGDPPTPGTLLSQGARLAAQHGCLTCHSIDGSPHIGPTWLGVYRQEQLMEDGARVVADEPYLTQSMMDPLARVVAGYKPLMPTYRGELQSPDAAAILEYIKSLRPTGDEGVAPTTPGPRYAPVQRQ